MFNRIDEVQRQYTYAVQPVKLFETQKNNPFAQKNSFGINSQTNSSEFNLLHPNVSNSQSGGKLDLMG
jgi:hypothetical protein